MEDRIIGIDANRFKDGTFGDSPAKKGESFAMLCYQLLKSNFNNIIPAKDLILFSDNSSDGGIDLIAKDKISEENKIFFQCKYINTPGRFKQIVNGIISDLRSHFDPNKPIRKQARPWFNEKLIRQYVLCVSCGLTPDKWTDAKTKLKHAFTEFGELKGLDHLQKIEVEVLFAKQLKTIFDDDYIVYHKWIKYENPEIKLVKNEIDQKNREIDFNSFLENQHLKYYSRKDFKKTLSLRDSRNFKDEEELLNFIIESKKQGLIISGPGGIGKTRLMLELGKLSISKDYVPVEVKKICKTPSTIIDFIRPHGRYILLFDYLEVQSTFDYIIHWKRVNPHVQLKIIANCRAGYIDEITTSYSEYFEFLHVGLNSKVELLFKKAIINSIISSIDNRRLVSLLKRNLYLNTFYNTIPAFAVFLKYNYYKTRVLAPINRNTKIPDWFKKRLNLTLYNRLLGYSNLIETSLSVFKILCCFPASKEKANEMRICELTRSHFLHDINKLRKDGWIDEEEDGTLKVVHDIIIDILFTEVLLHYNFMPLIIKEFIEFSYRLNSLSPMMWSIERIWDQIPEIKKGNVQDEIFRFIIDVNPDNLLSESWFKEKISETRLISEAKRIDFLIKFRSTLVDVFTQEKFGSSLSFSMNWLYKSSLNDEEKHRYKAYLKDLFFIEWQKSNTNSDFAVKASLGGKVISTYINLYGVDEYITSKIDRYFVKTGINENNLEYLSYVIVSYLDSNGEIDNILINVIKNWIDIHIAVANSSVSPLFLIASLNKRQLNNIVPLETVGKCLNQYWNDRYSGQLMGEWLAIGGSPTIIKDGVKLWLKKFCRSNDSLHLIHNWLLHSDDYLIVVSYIKICLKMASDSYKHRFIITNWLRKGNNPNLVRKASINWLSLYCGDKDSIYVANFWVRKGDDLKLVEKYIRTDFSPFLSERDSAWLIINWLDKGGRLNLISEHISQYIELFKSNERVVDLIAQWLRKRGEFTMVKQATLTCLRKYGICDLTYPVIKGLISNNIVDDELKPYISEAKKTRVQTESKDIDENSLSFEIKNHLKNGGDPADIREKTILFLDKDGDKLWASHVISAWIKYGNDFNIVYDVLIEWLETYLYERDFSSFVLDVALEDPLGFIAVKEKALLWLNNFGEFYIAKYPLSSWLKSQGPNDAKEIMKFIDFWIEHHYQGECFDWRDSLIVGKPVK